MSKKNSLIFNPFFLLVLQCNYLFLCRNVEILPNLYFEDFYRRSCNSSKNLEENEINGQASRSRQTVQVATRNSSVQQFLSHDLIDNVATTL